MVGLGLFGSSVSGFISVGVIILFIAWLWLLLERPAVGIQVASGVFTVVWKVLSAIVTGLMNLFGRIFRRR